VTLKLHMDLLATYAGEVASDSDTDRHRSPPRRTDICVAPNVPEDPVLYSDRDTPSTTAVPSRRAVPVHLDASAFDRQYVGFSTCGRVVDPATGQTRHAVVPRPRKRPRGAEVVENDEKSRAAAANSPNDESSATGHRERPVEDLRMGLPVPDESREGERNVIVPHSEFHLGRKALLDYRGQSWMTPPTGSRTFGDMEVYTAYIPKLMVHCYENAHDQGVGAIRFFPNYGHLLLSAGLDGVVKLWDTVSHKKCVRSYSGHSKGVRDVRFSNDGTNFLSASYDRTIKLWDTETGRVVSSFVGNRAIPYCVRFNPDEDKQTEFLAGCSDKKVIQMDVRDGNKIIQSYDQHMGAVNSVTFVDDNKRFVSSSDDKVLRVWEYGIPVVIKYVSDPTMHSMPVTVLHPNGKSLSCQSMDNNIFVYSSLGNFKLNRKKSFTGHLVAGYACGLSYSPDGRFIVSGDSLGRAFFWDWKTSRMYRTLKAHNGVCIDVAWHPTEASRVATCGWDGDIKLWN
jgi:pre-mRNA-processing factor 17